MNGLVVGFGVVLSAAMVMGNSVATMLTFMYSASIVEKFLMVGNWTTSAVVLYALLHSIWTRSREKKTTRGEVGVTDPRY